MVRLILGLSVPQIHITSFTVCLCWARSRKFPGPDKLTKGCMLRRKDLVQFPSTVPGCLCGHPLLGCSWSKNEPARPFGERPGTQLIDRTESCAAMNWSEPNTGSAITESWILSCSTLLPLKILLSAAALLTAPFRWTPYSLVKLIWKYGRRCRFEQSSILAP
jgi:hypothetical protein